MSILHLSPSSLISTITYSPRRTIRASRDSGRISLQQNQSPLSAYVTEVLKRLRPPKPDWYEELFAWFMDTGMESYEKEISDYKMKLFDNLVGKAEKSIGGTGPNFKYYKAIPNVSVLGVDPNPKMESYARKSALEAGLKSQDFRFIHAVAESIPLADASVDAVVGTLVLCSVADVTPEKLFCTALFIHSSAIFLSSLTKKKQ